MLGRYGYIDWVGEDDGGKWLLRGHWFASHSDCSSPSPFGFCESRCLSISSATLSRSAKGKCPAIHFHNRQPSVYTAVRGDCHPHSLPQPLFCSGCIHTAEGKASCTSVIKCDSPFPPHCHPLTRNPALPQSSNPPMPKPNRSQHPDE